MLGLRGIGVYCAPFNSSVGWLNTMKSYWTFLVALAATLSIGCNAPRNQNVTSSQSNPTPASPSLGVCGELLRDAPDGLRERWDAVLKDGKFRFAQASDFKLPNAEQPGPCHFGWSGELFAILIDTTETDNSRFKLALFVPPENGKGDYKLYWMVHNHDLSRSKLSNASSNLVVYEYLDGGGRRNSTLKWDKTKKAYVSMVA
jgi:hypothetical protein